MSWFAVYETSSGALISVGTSVADPVPKEMTVAALTDEQADAFRGGHGVWDDKTFTLIVLPPPEQQPTLEDKYTELIDLLVTKGHITEQEGGDVKPVDPGKETGEIIVPLEAAAGGKK